jgi:hypothetical protein
MKQRITELTGNHRRSLTSALVIVEQMLLEIKELLSTNSVLCCSEMQDDIRNEDRNQNLEEIDKALVQICKLAERYKTEKYHQSLKRAINAKKTKIWEILCDMKSRRQKGFGEFPKELVKEYDNNIDELLTIIDKINI